MSLKFRIIVILTVMTLAIKSVFAGSLGGDGDTPQFVAAKATNGGSHGSSSSGSGSSGSSGHGQGGDGVGPRGKL